MQAGPALLLLASTLAAAPDQQLDQALSRISEEAEVFRLTAPKIVAQEKLVQRALKPPGRFRPRLGSAALQPPKPQYRTREVISEYGFATFREAPGAIHEVRQVVSVDNRRVTSVEKARETLVAGLRSDDDRLKKRILENFEKHGLTGAATDFGQVLLLFTRARLPDYAFSWGGAGVVGTDPARIIEFRQRSGDGALTIFERGKALRQPLEGQLWIRESDGQPLRVVFRTRRDEAGRTVRDEAQVDYIMAQGAFLAPASVTHRQMRDADLVVENVYQYSAFRIFKVDAEIKFGK
ncbi:MAG: hypothetical protein ACM336_12255 [Acidobacteriota bacterium]